MAVEKVMSFIQFIRSPRFRIGSHYTYSMERTPNSICRPIYGKFAAEEKNVIQEVLEIFVSAIEKILSVLV